MKTSIPQDVTVTRNPAHAYQRNGERQLLLLSGDQTHCEKLVLGALERVLPIPARDSVDAISTDTVSAHPVGNSCDQQNAFAGQAAAIPWVAEDLPVDHRSGLLQHVHVKKATQLLGGSYRCVVYAAYPSFDANVFAALAGSVVGGGIFVLVRPFDSQLSAYDKYFASVFEAFRSRSTESFFLPCLDDESSIARAQHLIVRAFETEQSGSGSSLANFEASPAQKAFVSGTIEKLCGATTDGASSYCSLLKAKRGRGKTLALALLIQQLLTRTDSEQVWLCAPTRRQAQPVYDFLRSSSKISALSVEQRLRFCSVDQLLERIQQINPPVLTSKDASNLPLVVVDEAAALSLGLLKSLAQCCFRLVMATTTEGYEGSGRGFLLRYQEYLRDVFDTLDEWEFDQPLRWSERDKLEPFVDTACGLNWVDTSVQKASTNSSPVDTNQNREHKSAADLKIVIEKVSFARLSERLAGEQATSRRDPLLRQSLQHQIYQLLIDSHYQTRPSDLQRLYDADDHHLWIALCHEKGSLGAETPLVCGVLLAIEEGDFDRRFDRDLAEAVAAGERRPPGNLVAQKLSSHTCDSFWCRVPSLRVSRIVVAPAMQRSGLGSKLLSAMESSLVGSRINQSQAVYWSSSFGVNNALLQFWRANGAEVVFVGSKVDKASGERTAIVLKSVEKSVPDWSNGSELALGEGLSDIENTIAFAAALSALEAEDNTAPPIGGGPPDVGQWASSLAKLDHRRLRRLLRGRIDWDTAYPSFDRFLHHQLQADAQAAITYSASHSVALFELAGCLARNRGDWKAAAQALRLTGRRELVEFARQCLRDSGLFSAE